MAELILTVRKGLCTHGAKDYCGQCHSAAAEDVGCPFYSVSFHGECFRAKYKRIVKGVSAENFEICVNEDLYVCDEWAEVTIGENKYECDKVIVNGETVYPMQQED